LVPRINARRGNNQRAATYIPTYLPSTYLRTYNHLVSRWNSQRWLLLAAAAAAVGRQAAASNTGYLLHLLHLLLLVLSICLLPRATQRDLCPPPPSPFISSLVPYARARARVNLLYNVVVEITTTIQDYLPYRYHHGTVHTVHSAYYSGIASRPLQLHCGQRRFARTHTHMCMHIDDFMHTRTHEIQIRAYTSTYSYAPGTLVPSDAYVHTRAYTRAQRPSVALCLRPEISLACLANHGLDNNTVIDRTNPVLLHLLLLLLLLLHVLLRDHYRLVQPTASSKRVTFHPSREREQERWRESERERPTILSAPFWLSPVRSPRWCPPSLLRFPQPPAPRCLLSPRVCDFFIFSFIFFLTARTRGRARLRVFLLGRPRLPRSDWLRKERRKKRERERERDMLYFYVIRIDMREKRARWRRGRNDAWRIVDLHSKTSWPARFVTFRSFNNRVSAARQKLPFLSREPNRIGRNYIFPIFQSLAQALNPLSCADFIFILPKCGK